MHHGRSRKWLRTYWWPLRTPGRTSSSRTLWLSYGAMRAERASLWYRRMSIVYALGSWSVLGWVFFLARKQKVSDCEEGREDGSRYETPLSTSEDSDLATERTGSGEKFYVKTFLKYSEGSVPATQRILTYLKSWTGGPGPQT